MTIDIDKLTEDELVDLNRRVVARLNFFNDARTHKAMLQFSVGDRVAFQPDGKPQVSGVITRYNRKTVTVLADDGLQWNVSPRFLQRAGDSRGPTDGQNVLRLK
jgi:hypothetical protein